MHKVGKALKSCAAVQTLKWVLAAAVAGSYCADHRHVDLQRAKANLLGRVLSCPCTCLKALLGHGLDGATLGSRQAEVGMVLHRAALGAAFGARDPKEKGSASCNGTGQQQCWISAWLSFPSRASFTSVAHPSPGRSNLWKSSELMSNAWDSTGAGMLG